MTIMVTMMMNVKKMKMWMMMILMIYIHVSDGCVVVKGAVVVGTWAVVVGT